MYLAESKTTSTGINPKVTKSNPTTTQRKNAANPQNKPKKEKIIKEKIIKDIGDKVVKRQRKSKNAMIVSDSTSITNSNDINKTEIVVESSITNPINSDHSVEKNIHNLETIIPNNNIINDDEDIDDEEEEEEDEEE